MRHDAKSAGIGIALLVVTAIGARAGQGGELPRAEIVAFGTYAPSAQHGRMPASYRQDSIVEVTQADMPRLLAQTDRIEVRPCTRFGLEYRAVNLPPGAVAVAQVRVDHPLLSRPDGQRSAADTYDVPLRSSTGWTGLDFDEAWEMVPGTWTFTLVYAGHVLAAQRFAVVAPPAGTAAPKDCSRPVA
jgi:hypothetical protein